MPHRRSTASPANGSSPQPAGFRRRYDELERRRAALVARLAALAGPAADHPGRKRALKLLNETFRKSKLPQRLAVLQAAAWLIDVLEKLNSAT